MPVTLTDSEVEIVREIVGGGYAFSTIQVLLEDLNDAQKSAMQADADEWETSVRSKSHLRMQGGADGVDLNFDRRAREVRNRVRDRLGLPTTSGGLVHIPVVSGYGDCEEWV